MKRPTLFDLLDVAALYAIKALFVFSVPLLIIAITAALYGPPPSIH